jgi:O-antigen/teichoic acid export membrane protein
MKGRAGPTEAGNANRSKTMAGRVGPLLALRRALTVALALVLLAPLAGFFPKSSYGSYGAYAPVQVTVGTAGVVSGFGLSSAVVHFLAPSPSKDGSGWGAAKAAVSYSPLSGRVILLLSCIFPGVPSCFLCTELLKLPNPEDNAFLAHLLPARLAWVIPFLSVAHRLAHVNAAGAFG